MNLEHAKSRVEIFEYSADWPRLYEQERQRLTRALGSAATEIHHVGSTSVPGLAAKPCLDILVVTPSIPHVLSRQTRLEEIGYQSKGAYGGRMHHYFFRRLEQGRRKTHLHVVEQGHDEAAEYLLLRDYLRATPDVAATYGTYKQRLAGESGDREEYVTAKQSFVNALLVEARRWRVGSE